MQLVLSRLAYDVQDEEMFEKIKSFHEKAMKLFLEKLGHTISDKHKGSMSCPLKITLSNTLRTSGGNAKMGMFITLNYRLLKQNPDDLEWIYVHELAHIICQRFFHSEKGHGHWWRAVNSSMGFEPKRTHALDTSALSGKQLEHAYHCGCRIHMVSTRKHNMIQRGQARVCKLCKGKLVRPEGEILEMMNKVGIKTERKYQLIG